MSAHKVRPTGKRVLVLPTKPPEQTTTGIALPTAWQQPTGQARVVATGATVEDLQPGDTVFYAWINGRDVEHEGQTMRLLHENEILAKTQTEQ